jgi:hypothetical protein
VEGSSKLANLGLEDEGFDVTGMERTWLRWSGLTGHFFVGHNSPTIELPDLEIQQDVDESDSHSVVHENENNVAGQFSCFNCGLLYTNKKLDRLLGSSYSEQHTQEDVTIVNPDPYDDEWDDSLDGEGEPDINWEAEHDDIASNESSITLSSSASKRRYDEVDSEGAQGSLPDSPGVYIHIEYHPNNDPLSQGSSDHASNECKRDTFLNGLAFKPHLQVFCHNLQLGPPITHPHTLASRHIPLQFKTHAQLG